ncbi:MAG: AbrB/MazE/SpoVT family DNA-binding domain-containing protein [Bacteroidota bacterium]
MDRIQAFLGIPSKDIGIIGSGKLKIGEAIQIPESLKIDDDKVYLRKIGGVIYVIPFHNLWQSVIDSVDAFTEDFMEDRIQPSSQDREWF